MKRSEYEAVERRLRKRRANGVRRSKQQRSAISICPDMFLQKRCAEGHHWNERRVLHCPWCKREAGRRQKEQMESMTDPILRRKESSIWSPVLLKNE